jgi:hypothetical protein
MDSNGITLASELGVDGVGERLNRADEVEDVSGGLVRPQRALRLKLHSYSTQFNH